MNILAVLMENVDKASNDRVYMTLNGNFIVLLSNMYVMFALSFYYSLLHRISWLWNVLFPKTAHRIGKSASWSTAASLMTFGLSRSNVMCGLEKL